MLDDKTGWEIVWHGGEPLLPPRESKPSEVWTTKSRRKYTWKRIPQHSAEEQLETDNAQGT